MTEKERYATIGTWIKYFEEENGIEMTNNYVRKRLNKADSQGITAREKNGRVCTNGFYSEMDVRNACADLLGEVPRADKNGCIYRDGEAYMTVRSIARKYGITVNPIWSRITPDTDRIVGRLYNNQTREFFPEAEIVAMCAHLIEDIPQADGEDCINKDGEVYRTIPALALSIGVSLYLVRDRIQDSTPFIKGRSTLRKIRRFYCESDIRALCKDHTGDLNEANEDGFIVLDGESFAHVQGLCRHLGVSETTCKKRIKDAPFKKGLEITRRTGKFYSVSHVRELCADLLEEFPVADEDGLIRRNGKVFGTTNSLARYLGITRYKMLYYAERCKEVIIGRIKSGNKVKFYQAEEMAQLLRGSKSNKFKK